MKKNRWVLRLLALLALCGVLNVTALAVEAGSSGDPLVTLSYLNDTFLGTIMTQVDQKIAARNSQIAQQMGGRDLPAPPRPPLSWSRSAKDRL